MAALSEFGIRLSAMSPSYLHTNSTSHTGPFSAFAELVDNACDPGVTAKQLWIDVCEIKNMICLTVTDNGNGMTPNRLQKMLSFGFTEKAVVKNHHPIGIYGNGFKSGSMRLGKDALVFTKSGGAMTVGLLSQTYLEAIGANAIVIPTVPFNQQTQEIIVTEDSVPSLEAILKHTFFKTKEEVLEEFNAIPNKKGTRIIIWNLRRNKNDTAELDFTMDKHDIRIPSIGADENGRKGPRKLEKHDPFHTENSIRLCSLRDYLSILYLKPRMQIILRQKKVKAQLISKSLALVERDIYKPHFAKPVRITFGFSCKKDSPYGILMYHKNRLIKLFQKVGCQTKPSNIGNGVGVIGVVECNFLNPAHNKQDFEYSKEFRLTMINLGLKLNEYWKDKKCTKKQVMQDSTGDHEVTRDVPDQTWVQCDDCLNWRKLPEGIHHDSLPDKWYCSMNQDRRYRSCDIPEEPESSDEEYAPSYEKKSKRQRHKRLDSERSISPCWDTPKKQKTTLKMETKEENCKKPKKEDASSEDDTDYEKNDEILEVGSIKRRLRNMQMDWNKRKHHLDPEDTLYSEVHTSDTEEILPQHLSSKNKNLDDEDYDDVIIVEEKCVPSTKHIKVEQQDATTDSNTGEKRCSRTTSGGQSPTDMSAHVVSTFNQTDPEGKYRQDNNGKQTLKTASTSVQDNFDNCTLEDLYLTETAKTPDEQQTGSNMPELCSQTEAIQKCSGILKNTDNTDVSLKEPIRELEKERTVLRQQLAISQCDVPSSVASVKLGLADSDSQNVCLLCQQKSLDLDVCVQECKKTENALKAVTAERDELLQKVEGALREQNQLQQEYEMVKKELIHLRAQLEEQTQKMVFEPVVIKSELEILEAKNLELEERLNEAVREMEALRESTSTSIDLESPATRLKSLRINVAKLLATIVSDVDQEEVCHDNSRIDELLQKVVDSMPS